MTSLVILLLLLVMIRSLRWTLLLFLHIYTQLFEGVEMRAEVGRMGGGLEDMEEVSGVVYEGLEEVE